jgi:hypothetical protein
MLIQVSHLTSYEYGSPVTLGIHKLYLVPQHRPYFRIEHQKLSIAPDPAGQNFRQDLAGNWYKQAWFLGDTEKLSIHGEWIFKLHPFNPFGFIIDRLFEESGREGDFVLFNYEEKTAFLIPFLTDKTEYRFQEFLLPLFRESVGLVDFLVKLTAMIHRDWTHIIRHEQDIWSADQTFESQKGSCRDLALMQMEMLRDLGLAARFVSGYAFNPELEDGHELHAWMEVYLPGAGWVGLDPSLGLLTDQRYIPLACHPDPVRTLPVQGIFDGSFSSSLHTHVEIKLLHQGK